LNTLEVVSHSAITAADRAKIAYVYVRQSSVNQATHNSERSDLQLEDLDLACGQRLQRPREAIAEWRPRC
jgi:hypothetical protein